MRTLLENIMIMIAVVIILIAVTFVIFIEDIFTRHEEWHWAIFDSVLLLIYFYVKYLWKKSKRQEINFDEGEIYEEHNDQSSKSI